MFAFSRGELSSFAWETSRGVGAARSRPTSGIEDTTWRIRGLSNVFREEGQKKEGRSDTKWRRGRSCFAARTKQAVSNAKGVAGGDGTLSPLSIDDKVKFVSFAGFILCVLVTSSCLVLLRLFYQNNIKN